MGNNTSMLTSSEFAKKVADYIVDNSENLVHKNVYNLYRKEPNGLDECYWDCYAENLYAFYVQDSVNKTDKTILHKQITDFVTTQMDVRKKINSDSFWSNYSEGRRNLFENEHPPKGNTFVVVK